MKKTLAIFAMCAALVAGLALAGCSSSKSTDDLGLLTPGKLTVATSPDYPPFENLEGDEVVGFEVDLWNALGEKMGLEIEVVSMQFDAIIPAVVAGGKCDVGISGFSYLPERAEQVDFTESYFVDNQAVAVMKDSGLAAPADLNVEGKKIAVQTGTTGESWAQENYPNAQIIGFGNSNDCFAAMQSGKADAVCTNLAVVEAMLADAYSDATIVDQSATAEEYAMVVSKDNPALTQALNDAIAELQKDGTIDELAAKWFQ